MIMNLNTKQSFGMINALRLIQGREYTYDEFFHILKRRTRIFTGLEEVMFYDEKKLCKKIIELGLINTWKK